MTFWLPSFPHVGERGEKNAMGFPLRDESREPVFATRSGGGEERSHVK